MRIHRLRPMTSQATMGCARPTTEIEPTARSLIEQSGLLGEVYRCIKRQYTAMAVPTWRMLVSPNL